MNKVFSSIILLTMAAVATIPASAKNEKSYRADDSAIRYTGRTMVGDDGAVSFDWVGTYLDTRLTGGELAIEMSNIGTAYFNVFVDGELHNVVKATGADTTITFVRGIDRKKPHHITIQKRTEGEFGKMTLRKFIVPQNGSLAAEPRTRTRHIEFIGNSLTCGYGVMGESRDEPFKLETENCYYSFSNLIPRYFDADYSLIAHSGKGVIRNYGDSVRISKNTVNDRMLNTFDETRGENPVWENRTYQPDLVVINLGTNDFSLEPQPYKSEFVEYYCKMINKIRQQYGDVPILCVYCCTIPAPVYSYYEAAVDAANDPNVHLFKMQSDLLDDNRDLGAVWHPNRRGHQKFAQSLIPYISSITGWDLPAKPIE